MNPPLLRFFPPAALCVLALVPLAHAQSCSATDLLLDYSASGSPAIAEFSAEKVSGGTTEPIDFSGIQPGILTDEDSTTGLDLGAPLRVAHFSTRLSHLQAGEYYRLKKFQVVLSTKCHNPGALSATYLDLNGVAQPLPLSIRPFENFFVPTLTITGLIQPGEEILLQPQSLIRILDLDFSLCTSTTLITEVIVEVDVCSPTPSISPLYVDHAASGKDDGTSWDDAYPDLQRALTAARAGDQIWVAEGTYLPGDGLSRSVTFELSDGVALYGGFPAGGSAGSRLDRDPVAFPTILSGDFNGDDLPGFLNRADNAFRVVRANSVGAATRLDGFHIRGADSNASGGGLMCNQSSLCIHNCIFLDNQVSLDGGGASVLHGSPSFINCLFLGNTAGDNGGALFFSNSPSALFVNCLFQGNQAGNNGGAYRSTGSSPTFVNCTFTGNAGNGGAGAIRHLNSFPTFHNCLIWHNTANGATGVPAASLSNEQGSVPLFSHCLVENFSKNDLDTSGDSPDTNLEPADPLFAHPADPAQAPGTEGNARLLNGSPALDTGDHDLYSDANGPVTDFTGIARTISSGGPTTQARLDLGAFEGSYVSFSSLYPTLDPGDDANGNGLTNFHDYAAGFNPTAAFNPLSYPELNGSEITFTFRHDAADVFPFFQSSPDLRNWFTMIEGLDYTVLSTSSDSSRTTVTLDLAFDPATESQLFFSTRLQRAP